MDPLKERVVQLLCFVDTFYGNVRYLFFLVLKKCPGAALFCFMAIGIVDVQECSLLLSLKRAT